LRPAIPAEPDDWVRQFIRHLEIHVLDASRDLAPDVNDSELQAAAARAVITTFLDSGMDLEAALELLGRAAIESRSPGVAWTDVMNRRRFALIDKEIQGTLTPAEGVELAGLTRVMREEVESETNLPMEGARALHRKLLQLEPTGEPD
jgi:hypothetical protein